MQHEKFQKWFEAALHTALPFSFKYNGIASYDLLTDCARTASTDVSGPIRTDSVTYEPEDGLVITMEMKTYSGFDAADWVIRIKNQSAGDSRVFSDVFSCDTTLMLDKDAPATPGLRPPEDSTRLFSSIGSPNIINDFMPNMSVLRTDTRPQTFAGAGGRSSNKTLPVFDIVKRDEGIICAIGWTGQWKCTFARNTEGVRVTAGLEKTNFLLHPGEEIRTPSMVMMFWDGGMTKGHNTWRRLVLEHFSPKGRDGKNLRAPLCIGSWGGMKSESHLNKLAALRDKPHGCEIYWVDAGWYGHGDSPSEFVGDWWKQVGNWEVNEQSHPEGLEAIARAAKAAGMEFLVWFEIERAIHHAKLPTEHPEWFLWNPDDTNANRSVLLNLTDAEAFDWLVGYACDKISSLNLKGFRQDFNIDPLVFWQKADAEDRVGITETKYITALYRFWDTLRERFPDLIIDNCASGGRRIDIETARRAMPLWRSDYQCVWDCDPTGAQIHLSGISWWFPISGTGAGRRPGDTYAWRSSYSPGMNFPGWAYEGWEVEDDYPWDWHEKIIAEYKRVREYFYGDYYSLTVPATDSGALCAWQFDRPDLGSGAVQVFRRPDSVCECANLALGGIDPDATYEIEESWDGETVRVKGRDLINDGFWVSLPEKRGSKVYFYKKLA